MSRRLSPVAYSGRLLRLQVFDDTAAVAQHVDGVTDVASGQPIMAAQVHVVGTNIGAQTNTEGQYTLRGVAPGSVGVLLARGERAFRESYEENERDAAGAGLS